MFRGQDQIFPSTSQTLNPNVAVSLSQLMTFFQTRSQKLQQRATHFLMGYLVDTFADLAHLQMFVPEIEPIHPVQKRVKWFQ